MTGGDHLSASAGAGERVRAGAAAEDGPAGPRCCCWAATQARPKKRRGADRLG
jgi:hypothetical protein